MLAELNCPHPAPTACPSGEQYCDQYLDPLTRWLESRPDCEVLINTKVISISRGEQLKGDQVDAAARSSAAFAALLDDGEEERWLDGFSAVLDCSGTYGNGNYLGRGGAPAIGERGLRMQPRPISTTAIKPPPGGWPSGVPPIPRDAFFDGLPDVLGLDEPSFLPRPGSRTVTIAIVGGGYSAATTIRSVLELAASRHHLYEFTVHWLLRKPYSAGAPYRSFESDPLPARAALVDLANNIASQNANEIGERIFGPTYGVGIRGIPGAPNVIVHRGVAVERVGRQKDGRLRIDGTRDAPPAKEGEEEPAAATEPFSISLDTMVSHCGYRPSYDLASEMRVHVCYESDGPIRLAAALKAAKADGGGGDCLEMTSSGIDQLKSPEPNFYILGAKSYGRDSNFLLRTGFEQVSTVVEGLVAALLPADGRAEPAAVVVQQQQPEAAAAVVEPPAEPAEEAAAEEEAAKEEAVATVEKDQSRVAEVSEGIE